MPERGSRRLWRSLLALGVYIVTIKDIRHFVRHPAGFFQTQTLKTKLQTAHQTQTTYAFRYLAIIVHIPNNLDRQSLVQHSLLLGKFARIARHLRTINDI